MKFVADSLLMLLAIAKPVQSARLGLFRLDTEDSVPNHRVAKEFGGSVDDDDTKQSLRELFGPIDLSLSMPPIALTLSMSMPTIGTPTASPATPVPTAVPGTESPTASAATPAPSAQLATESPTAPSATSAPTVIPDTESPTESQATLVPTAMPDTKSPTASPTEPVPTALPTTTLDTESPTAPSATPPPSPVSVPPIDTCETSYAYCPGLSECFIGNYITSPGGGPKGPWGWNIDLITVDLTNGNTLTCPVYSGAGQCDFENKGTQVGSLIISENAVTWDFFNGFGGEDFHLYAGKCGANDRGRHLEDGVCDPDDIDSNARVPGQYTLVAPNEDDEGSDIYNPVLTDFGFDDSNDEGSFRKGIWKAQGYAAFPLVGADRRYLSAHASVCACTAVSGGCTTPAVGITGNDSGTNNTESGLSTSSQPALIVAAVAAALLVAVVVVWRRMSGSTYHSVSSVSDSKSASMFSAL